MQSKMPFLARAEAVYRKMPVNYKPGELDFCKDEFAYQTNYISATQHNNVLVTGTGLVLNASLQPVPASKTQERKLNPLQQISQLLFWPKRKMTGTDYALCFDANAGSHYHWICEFLPRLYAAKHLFSTHVFLLPDTEYARTTGTYILQQLGLLPPTIEWVQPRSVLKIKNLTLIDQPVQTGRIHDPLMQQLKKQLYKTFPPDLDAATKRIYISREHAQHRKLLNEHDVQAVFFAYGFDILRFEKLSFKEQIQLSQSASIVASMHGTVLSNAFFMQPGAAVMEFRRSGIYRNQCFWHLADAMQLDYYYQFGQPDANTFIEGTNSCNLTLSVKALEKNLDLFLSKQALSVAT